MIRVRFHDSADDALFRFAVVAARHNGKWVFCKHRQRDTLELPGGHREDGESILHTAQRELWEETGATAFDLTPVCPYSVRKQADPAGRAEETYGMLYHAEIAAFGALPALEIERIELRDAMPNNWTYPEIQPLLLQKASERCKT